MFTEPLYDCIRGYCAARCNAQVADELVDVSVKVVDLYVTGKKSMQFKCSYHLRLARDKATSSEHAVLQGEAVCGSD
jgi:hypothetical protein